MSSRASAYDRGVDSSARSSERKFASRAGLKLDHALAEFDLDVTGFVCADFGCNVGGFTDVLLQRGAAKVFAIDTGYGVLDYRLRTDSRVVVMERTNALHAKPQAAVDLVVIDLAWTPQRFAIPAAVRWLNSPLPLGEGSGVRASATEIGGSDTPSPQPLSQRERGFIITLVKPHYELDEAAKKTLLKGGRLDPNEAERVLHRVLDEMPSWSAKPVKWTRSPITGGKSGRGSKEGGNVEFLVLAEVV